MKFNAYISVGNAMSSDKMNAYKKQKRYLRFFLRYTFMVKNIAPFFG